MHQLLQRKYLISFCYLMICIGGYLAWSNIPLENTPELNLPSITVNYTWGSTSPEVVEQEITRKVENALSRLRDVTRVESVTSPGRSSVTATFAKQAPVDYRILELREYLFSLERELPPTVSPANISRRVPEELEDQQTFIIYTLSGSFTGRQLLEYARTTIKTNLLGIPGLADVEIQGVLDPALTIEFDADKVEQLNLSTTQLMSAVRDKLSWSSAGYLDTKFLRTSLVIPPAFTNTGDIEAMEIEIPGSLRPVKLGEIADVFISDYPAKSMKRVNGNPALTIEFVKEGGADALALAEEIIARMQTIEASLPEGMEQRLQRDATEQLREQFSELQFQALISGILVFLVVLLFIRKLRAPFVIMGSVVFSVLISLGVLYLIGYTLNIITLAGITVALGMLIDNAVVVFEQVNPGLPRSKKERLSHIVKKLPGAGVPVMGSTLTTIGIFVPLLFALDDLRIFLVPLAVALTITLASSVLVAFTWIPYALTWLTPGSVGGGTSKRWSFRKATATFHTWRHRFRWVFLLLLIAAVGLPLFLIEDPDWEDTHWPEFTRVYFDNRSDIDPVIGGVTYRFVNNTYFGSPWRGRAEERISVFIRPPQGTPLSEIDKIVRNYEKIVKPYEHAFSYYEAQMSEYYGATIQFVVKPEYLFRTDPYHFFGEAMFLAARTGNVATSVSGFGDGISTGFGGGGSSHRIRLRGYAYEELLNLAKDLKRRLEKSRRVREVDINAGSFYSRDRLYQYVLALDDEELAARGLDRRKVLASLALDLNPVNSFGKVEFQGKEMFLVGRNEEQRSYQEDLTGKVRQFGKVNFDVASVGQVQKERVISEIRRENQSYQRNVEVEYLGSYRMGREYIRQVLDELPVPVGASVDYGFSGFSFTDDEDTRNLLLIILLSILSVWMITAALLESIKYPLAVILSVPFSLLGVMAGTLFNDLAFDRGAIAGTLLCIGVVVNNAILLIHEHQSLIKKNIRGLRNWMYVYERKLRAILITSVTTISGLIPMIVFGSDEFWETLAVVVVWGLSFSTVLLLLFFGYWKRSSGEHG